MIQEVVGRMKWFPDISALAGFGQLCFLTRLHQCIIQNWAWGQFSVESALIILNALHCVSQGWRKIKCPVGCAHCLVRVSVIINLEET